MTEMITGLPPREQNIASDKEIKTDSFTTITMWMAPNRKDVQTGTDIKEQKIAMLKIQAEKLRLQGLLDKHEKGGADDGLNVSETHKRLADLAVNYTMYPEPFRKSLDTMAVVLTGIARRKYPLADTFAESSSLIDAGNMLDDYLKDPNLD